MLDIGWSEMLIVAIVAIIVIGPKDLPKLLRGVGYWVGKVRSAAREFQNSIEDMISDPEVDELRKNVRSIQIFDANNLVESNRSSKVMSGTELSPTAGDYGNDRQLDKENMTESDSEAGTTNTKDQNQERVTSQKLPDGT